VSSKLTGILRLRERLGRVTRPHTHLRLPRGGLAASFLLLLVLLYFWPFLLRGEVIAPTDLLLQFPPWSSQVGDDFHVKNTLRSDIVDAYLPTLKQIKEGVLDGHLPLWTPFKAQGRPLASSLDSSFFHPLTLFFVTVFPLAAGFSLLTMSKLFLAGVFMYLFLRRWEVSRAGSVLGGVAYMFSGFNVVWLLWPHTLVSCFAPLLFLQVENLVRSPRPLNIALLSVVVAMMVLGGFPSVAGYFFYAAGLYVIVRLIQTLLAGAGWKTALWTAGAFGLAFALGAGITAFQLLPTLEHTDFIDIDYRRGLSHARLPLKQGIQLAFPNYYGNQVFGNFEGGGLRNLNESSGYVGIIVLGFAVWGFGVSLLRRRGPAVFLGVLALLSLAIVYRIGPFLDLVSALPVFDSNPSTRLLSVFGFSAAGVAAFGFDELRQFRPVGWLSRASLLAVGVAGATVAGMLGYLGYEIVQRRELLSNFVHNFPIIELHTFRLVTVAYGLSLVMLFLILVFLHLRRSVAARPFALVVLVLVSSDLLVFGYRQNPTVADEYFYPETPAIRFLETDMRPYERMAPFDYTFLIPGTQLFYGLNSSFSHTLHTSRHKDLIASFSEKAFKSATAPVPRSKVTDFSSPIIDVLGIKFITVPATTDLFEGRPELRERYDLVYENPGELRIYENKRFAPAFVAPTVIHMEDPEEILATMQRSDFNPREVAIVEEAPPREWEASLGAASESASSVVVTDYGSDSAAYEVEASTPALLVVPELYHPGWEASVDGQSTKIYQADYILRGVFVSAGQHKVEFTYRPASFRTGLIISVVALCVVCGLIALDAGWRRLRRAREDP
jgi:hypothetical protein